MSRTFSESVKAFGAKQVFSYLQKDPEKHIPQILDWLDKYGGSAMPGQLAFVRRVLEDPNNKWHQYTMDIFKDINPHCIDKFMEDPSLKVSTINL